MLRGFTIFNSFDSKIEFDDDDDDDDDDDVVAVVVVVVLVDDDNNESEDFVFIWSFILSFLNNKKYFNLKHTFAILII